MKPTYIRLRRFLFFWDFDLMCTRRQLTETIIMVIRMLMLSEIASREHLSGLLNFGERCFAFLCLGGKCGVDWWLVADRNRGRPEHPDVPFQSQLEQQCNVNVKEIIASVRTNFWVWARQHTAKKERLMAGSHRVWLIRDSSMKKRKRCFIDMVREGERRTVIIMFAIWSRADGFFFVFFLSFSFLSSFYFGTKVLLEHDELGENFKNSRRTVTRPQQSPESLEIAQFEIDAGWREKGQKWKQLIRHNAGK